jgi:hypothetical protein
MDCPRGTVAIGEGTDFLNAAADAYADLGEVLPTHLFDWACWR